MNREFHASSPESRIGDLPAPVALSRLDRAAPGRAEVERFVRTAFAQRYGARVRELPACLMALRRAAGELTAVAGLRFAATGPLFLEQYLDAPIEAYLAPARSVAREGIVEIGSLSAHTPGQVRYLMIALAAYLYGAGYQWVVCTAVSSVRNTLSRLGLTPVLLGTANPARLGEAATEWGSYYEQHPHIIAGRVTEGAVRLETRAARPEGALNPLWCDARELGRRDAVARSVGGAPAVPAPFALSISA